MLQVELSETFVEFLVSRFGIIFAIGTLSWCVIYYIYDRGHLGSWPPSRRSVRIVAWILVLFPVFTLVVIEGSLLLGSIIVPSIEPQLMLLVDQLDLVDYLALIFLFCFLFAKVLRWCWKRFGTTGVIITISISYSATIFFTSLNLISGRESDIFEFGTMAWCLFSIMEFCNNRDLMKPRSREGPRVSIFGGHRSTEIAIRSIYNSVVPLIRRIIVDDDESALRILKSFLEMDGDFEREIELACKALGFNRKDLLDAPDTGRVSVVLQKVAFNWGNFSKLDFSALSLVLCTWVISGVISIWALINGTIKEDFVAFVVFIMLPFAVLGILSVTDTYRPDREFTILKRYNEAYRFTHNEFRRRRLLDSVLLVITLIAIVCVAMVITGFGDPSLTPTAASATLVLFVLTIVLVRFDSFLLGSLPSEEETVALLRGNLLLNSPRDMESVSPPDDLNGQESESW